MCGIFGVITKEKIDSKQIKYLAKHSEQRGKDSSGMLVGNSNNYNIHRAAKPISSLLRDVSIAEAKLIMGHSRLVTNGLSDNQPVYRDGVCVIHNGIVVNHNELWDGLEIRRQFEIDTEIIAAIAADFLRKGGEVDGIANQVLEKCKGIVACAVAIPKLGKLCLFSNNGSLYYGRLKEAHLFASESYPLENLNCESIFQVRSEGMVINIPNVTSDPLITEHSNFTTNLIPELGTHRAEENMLEYKYSFVKRCSKCILPETMPFIFFDQAGVCNYCHGYKPRNTPRPVEELFKIVEPYRRNNGNDCIIPFSGGRDSSYGLHLVAKELKMKPVTYTYDWGMVTDLARRNISRMCSILGVENIIVAADIGTKRRNIAMNLNAWLKSPNLGMLSILTAGDKHAFRLIEDVKRQTGISLNLWGVNPLEITHFKSGFLGVRPDFEEDKVYSNGLVKQLKYHWLRFQAMLQSPSYFNTSLWDTFSSEIYRSFIKKSDYYHIFDYWRWDEKLVDNTLIGQYDWERAPDTNTTWRIGDGSAAFYNYIYYTVAGFTEHDTFRSNQIREGDISREKALELVEDENRPRYPNIKWYLDAIGMDFNKVILTINAIPKLYTKNER